jgi:hypothetical protein
MENLKGRYNLEDSVADGSFLKRVLMKLCDRAQDSVGLECSSMAD